MEGMSGDLDEIIDAVRDVTFSFFNYQTLTATILQPYNDFLSGPLQEIIMMPLLYGNNSKLGLAEFSNVVFVPPFRGNLVDTSVGEKLAENEAKKEAKLKSLLTKNQNVPKPNLTDFKKAEDVELGRLKRQFPDSYNVHDVRDARDAELDRLRAGFTELEDQEADEYLRKKALIMQNYLALERDILRHAYATEYISEKWLLPKHCREQDLTYSLDVYADITLSEYPTQGPNAESPLDEAEERLQAEANTSPISRRFYLERYGQQRGMIQKTYTMQKLFSIPLMVGSAWCWLTLSNFSPENMSLLGECEIAPKGYFIVSGNSRAFITQIKLTVNEPRCQIEKGTGPKGTDKIVMNLKCETRTRKANNLYLAFGSPSEKSKEKGIVKVLYVSLPFMGSDFDTEKKKKVKGNKNISFNILWVFRFYVIWYCHKKAIPLTTGQSIKYALSQFEKHLSDICHEPDISPESQSVFMKVFQELADTVIHFNLSEDGPVEDEKFVRKLKEDYRINDTRSTEEVKKKLVGQEDLTLIIERFKTSLDAQFFPQIQCEDFELTQENDVWKPFTKFTALTHMIVDYVKAYSGARGVTDRDSFETIQLATSAVEMGILLRKAMAGDRGVRAAFSDSLKSDTSGPGFIFTENGVPNAIKALQSKATTEITQTLISCFNTGKWGLSRGGGGEKRPGVVQLFETKSLMSQYNLLRKTAIPMKANSSIEVPRRVHKSTYGITDPTNTPDSEQVGLIRSLCLSVMISSDNPTAYDYVMTLIEEAVKRGFDVFDHMKNAEGETRYPLFVDNIIAGYCNRKFYDDLKEEKHSGRLGYLTEVYLKRNLDKWHTTFEVHVKTVAGRAMRPLIIVKNNELPILNVIMGPKGEEYRADFGRLLREGYVEYVSVSEFHFSEVAENLKKFYTTRDRRKFDYVELDAIMSMSVEIATQPHPQHNPNPRALYYAGMVRQAMGIPMATYAQQQETESKILLYPHAPLITTDMAKITRAQEQPHGQMVYVAIKSEPGTDEDPTRWRRGFIENGGLNGMIYNTYQAKITVNVEDEDDDPTKYDQGIIRTEYEGEPEEDEDEDESMAILKKYAAGRVIVKPGDMLVRFKMRQDENSEIKTLTVTGNRAGYISQINVFNSPSRTIKITVASPHIPGEGDKAASEFSQKGVMGQILEDEDMPTNMETGLKPDVIFSPTSLPSRMTIGMPLAMLAGSAFASMNKNMIVKTLINWPREQAIPIITDENDFWIILVVGYTSAKVEGGKFHLETELKDMVTEEVKAEMEAHRVNEPEFEFEYPEGILDEAGYIESKTHLRIKTLQEEGYVQRYGFVLKTTVAERVFITPDEDCISILKTDEKVVLFSQLPRNLKRMWYEENENMLIPNYMLLKPRAPNDESVTDATAFRSPNVEYLYDILEKKGYDRHSESKFIDKYGHVTSMKIFSGPLFYMQLAHLTDSKYQVRDQGAKSVVSKGAKQGGSKGGVSRQGELSQYALYAWGVGVFLKERFMLEADPYNILVCRKPDCGRQCYIQSVTNRVICETCGSTEDPHSVMVPYSSVRLMNMMGAGGAALSFITKAATEEDLGEEYEYEKEEEQTDSTQLKLRMV